MLDIYVKFYDLCDCVKRGKIGGGFKVFYEGYLMLLLYLEVRVIIKEGKDWGKGFN